MTATQLDLPTAIARGREQQAIALENTRMTEISWPERAWSALVTFANDRRGGSAWTAEAATDFVVAIAGPPHDTRATGGLFGRLKRHGIACQTDEFYRRAHGNGTFARKWITL